MIDKIKELPLFFQFIGGIVIVTLTIYFLILIALTIFETSNEKHERLCYQLCQQGNNEACVEFFKLK